MDKFFQDNPDLKEYFKTSDGQAFYSENGAKNHVKTAKLANQHIECVVRGGETELNDDEKPVDLKKLKKAELIVFAQKMEPPFEVPAGTNAEMAGAIEAEIARRAAELENDDKNDGNA